MKQKATSYYHKKTFWEKFWHDKDGRLVVWQSPNALLWSWLALFLLSEFFRNDITKFLNTWVGFIIILIWAGLEAKSGVNYFRRMLGVLVFILVILIKF